MIRLEKVEIIERSFRRFEQKKHQEELDIVAELAEILSVDFDEALELWQSFEPSIDV